MLHGCNVGDRPSWRHCHVGKSRQEVVHNLTLMAEQFPNKDVSANPAATRTCFLGNIKTIAHLLMMQVIVVVEETHRPPGLGVLRTRFLTLTYLGSRMNVQMEILSIIQQYLNLIR